MSGINMARVIAGGLVAGLVISIGEFVLNTLVIKKEMDAAIKAMGLPDFTGATIGTFVFMVFLLGIATVWLYAAIRPRFGAGAGTAACAGSAAWFFAYLYPSVGMWAMGMFPGGTLAIALAWGLAEVVAGAVAGAWVYREQGSRTAAGV
jgi:hypothetical protein